MKQTHEGYVGERQRGKEAEKPEHRKKKKKKGSDRGQRPHCNECKEGNRIS